jgi:hypothetical protein
MATVPSVSTFSATSADVLNAIRNNASTNYRDYVPVATTDESVKEVGSVIMQFQPLQNEFLDTLVNRIGLVLIKNKMFSNPWTMFKKGILDMGETVEEIFVNLAEPYVYDEALSESTVFQREVPDVRAAYHNVNYQTMYQTTVNKAQLRKAFTTPNGVVDLVEKITSALYSSAANDEFHMMKYVLARHICNGQIKPVTVPTVAASNASAIASAIKAVSNNFEYMGDEYNLAGVQNFSLKDSQYLVMSADFDAVMSVNVLAQAFHMDEAKFIGHQVGVDSFGKLNVRRINRLMGFPDDTELFTSEELALLDTVPAVIIDTDWFMVYDQEPEFNNIYNPKGRYWNYFLHCWKCVSMSPFANGAVLVPGTPAVTSITVSPDSATVYKGQHLQLSAEVATSNFAPKAVDWTSSDPDNAPVSSTGVVQVGSGASGTVTVTATSVYDASKTAKATLTVA